MLSMKSIPILQIISGVLALAAPDPALAGSQSSEKPNLVVVLVDDLGWTDLGCYGSSFHDTPHVDALAASGIRFTQAYAASPVCSPTRAALMTGKHPVRVGITDWIRGYVKKNPLLKAPEDRDELALEEVTLAEALRQQGYRTAYVGKWHLGETEEFWPEHQGFEVNIGGFSKGSPPGGYYSPYENPRLADGPKGEYLTDRLTTEAIQYIRDHREDPFFLYLAFYTVHTPIQGCDKWDGHYQEKLETSFAGDAEATREEGPARTRLHQADPKYAAMVRSMDENVGRLLNELEALGLADNTVVVFTSDNGGLSTQPGRIAPTSVLPLRAGKGWCYEGGIRIPLIIRAPGMTISGSQSEQTSISMDLFPTLLELAGLEIPGNLDGLSLVQAIREPGTSKSRTLFWHYPHYHSSGWTPGSAIRNGEWKLIERYETGALELYDLSVDISEQRDLSASLPDILREMTQLLRAEQTRLGAALPARP